MMNSSDHPGHGRADTPLTSDAQISKNFLYVETRPFSHSRCRATSWLT